MEEKKVYTKKELEEICKQEIKIINNKEVYTKKELDNLLREEGFVEDCFSRYFKKYDIKKYEEVTIKLKSGHVFYLKEFVDSLDFDYIKRLKIKERKILFPKGISFYTEFLKHHYNEPNFLEIYEYYYSASDIARILESEDVGITNRTLDLGLLNYSQEKYDELTVKHYKRIYYSKEFIDSLNFNYLKKALIAHGKSLTAINHITQEFFKHHFKEDNKLDLYENSYTSSQLVQIFKEKGITIGPCSRSLLDALRKSPNVYKEAVTEKDGVYYFNKKFIDSINYEILKMLKENKCYSIFNTYIKYYEFGIIPGAIASRILGCNPDHVLKIRRENRNHIFSPVDQGESYVKYEEVLKWKEFKESTFGVHQVTLEISKKIPEKIRADKIYYNRQVLKMYERGDFNKFKPVREQDAPFLRTWMRNQLYIKKIYKDEVYQLIEEQLFKKSIERSTLSQVETFNVLCDTFNKKESTKKTFKYLKLFAIDRISTVEKVTPYVYYLIVREIEKLDKSIADCSTEELMDMYDRLNHKKSKGEFIGFTKYIKSLMKVKYSLLDYDPAANIEFEANVKPYSMEQYIRFGFLVWSDTHVWYESYMEKALKNRKNCSVWLYAALHYISAWRAGDLQKQFPRPKLNMKPELFLQKVRNKELDDKIAMDIIEQVNLKIELDKPIPSKTKHHDPASLVLQIPESVYVFLGTLIGVAEAHAQINGSKTLIGSNGIKKEYQREFFGEEFINIFGEDSFINTRAVKNYEQLMTKYGDQEQIGTGYVLASIARSHKFTTDKLAETTQIYLRFYKEMEDSEILFRELFERGVCSFAPYLLVKIIEGEDVMKLLSPQEQTKKIKSLNTKDPYDVEMFLEVVDESLSYTKEVIKDFLKYAGEKGLEPKEFAKESLERLSYNKASSKQNKMPCMLRAQGRECIYPKRKYCVGCGYEVYVKSCLVELGKMIHKFKQQAITSKTKNSQKKNILMIQNVLSPIAREILITLKNVIKVENLDEYKKLLQ